MVVGAWGPVAATMVRCKRMVGQRSCRARPANLKKGEATSHQGGSDPLAAVSISSMDTWQPDERTHLTDHQRMDGKERDRGWRSVPLEGEKMSRATSSVKIMKEKSSMAMQFSESRIRLAI